ncbi:hypothetical protein Prum_020440 [Phytohabitans rumicis]|uniref:Lipoprotein n=2 Tax=Phytohabitans rumicis TaxID=1076125 RepID=A0A6V8KTF7_9ACTN|nr:hypothetical protein Prum_020440 [Phytohabitans rumicis]
MRTLALGLLLCLAVAGCGGADGDDGIATAGGTPSASASAGGDKGTDQENMLKYAQCMRDNGVPDFPDPKMEGGGISFSLPQGADKAKVDAAQEKCKSHLPNGGEAPKADPERLEQMRKLSECMRANGVPNFPDPSEDGGIALDMSKLGLSGPDDPKLKAAEEKCKSFQPEGPEGGSKDQRTDG